MSHILPSLQTPVWVSGTRIRKIYGISIQTLHRWEEKGCLKTLRPDGSNRLYLASDVDKLFQANNGEHTIRERRKIIYARVSSSKQKTDLDRQCQTLQELYPEHELIKDIGSGVNYKRKGFISILEAVHNRNVEEVVVLVRKIYWYFQLLIYIVQG